MEAIELLEQLKITDQEYLLKVFEQMTLEKYQKAVEIAFDFFIQRTKTMRESCFDKYAELAFKGIPYRDRLGTIDHAKLGWCDAKLTELQSSRRNYKLRPLHEWLEPEDCAWIKAFGFVRFIQMHLEEAITKS